MKELDKVELIKDRAAYKEKGVKVGNKGLIMGGARNGYVLVFFDGKEYMSRFGVKLIEDIDVAVRVEDLKVIE